MDRVSDDVLACVMLEGLRAVDVFPVLGCSRELKRLGLRRLRSHPLRVGAGAGVDVEPCQGRLILDMKAIRLFHHILCLLVDLEPDQPPWPQPYIQLCEGIYESTLDMHSMFRWENLRLLQSSVRIMGAGRDATTLSGFGFRADGLGLRSIKIERLRITKAKSAITVFGGAEVEVIDCEIDHCTGCGILLSNGACKLTNTFVHHNGGGGVFSSAHAKVNLDECTITDNDDFQSRLDEPLLY